MKVMTIISLALLGLITLPVWSLPVVGRVDSFENGTTQGWEGRFGDLTPLPANITTGGPAGPNDSYMEIRTNGFHLATHNDTRSWTGDYLSVGVKAITMDLVRLTGDTDIRLSLALIGPGGMFAVKERTPPLNDQQGWRQHHFHLGIQDVVHVANGTGIYADTLRDVTKILIRHDKATPTPPGNHPPHVTAAVGIDNITAVLRDFDAAWTFGNQGASAYLLEEIEPSHVPLGDLNIANPTLNLVVGQRYKITIDSFEAHPIEIIAKGNGPNDDTVLLSLKPNVTTPWEADKTVDWIETVEGNITFTLTPELHEALQGTASQVPGYRCAIHRQTMRGDFEIME